MIVVVVRIIVVVIVVVVVVVVVVVKIETDNKEHIMTYNKIKKSYVYQSYENIIKRTIRIGL